MGLMINRREGESFVISTKGGEDIIVTIHTIDRQVRVRIDAPDDVAIMRTEVCDKYGIKTRAKQYWVNVYLNGEEVVLGVSRYKTAKEAFEARHLERLAIEGMHFPGGLVHSRVKCITEISGATSIS